MVFLNLLSITYCPTLCVEHECHVQEREARWKFYIFGRSNYSGKPFDEYRTQHSIHDSIVDTARSVMGVGFTHISVESSFPDISISILNAPEISRNNSRRNMSSTNESNTSILKCLGLVIVSLKQEIWHITDRLTPMECRPGELHSGIEVLCWSPRKPDGP